MLIKICNFYVLDCFFQEKFVALPCIHIFSKYLIAWKYQHNFFLKRIIFGLSKNGVRFLVNLALPYIATSERRNTIFLTPIQKICIFLDFLRTNSFQRSVASQSHNRITQSTCCVTVNTISRIFARLQSGANATILFFV